MHHQSVDTASHIQTKLDSLLPVEMDILTAHFKAERYSDLEETAHKLLIKYPDSGFVWKALSVALNRQGKDALYAFQKSAELAPHDAEAQNNFGIFLNAQGWFDEAVVNFRYAIKINPNFADAYCNLGKLLQRTGYIEEAVENFQKALSIDPLSAEVHWNCGKLLYRLGRFGEAFASYQQALKLAPEIAEIYHDMGNTLRMLKQFDLALLSFRKALDIKPDFVEAHSGAGAVLYDLGRVEEALSYYRQSISLDPGFAEAHSNLGVALQVLGRFDEALYSYRRALDSKPDFVAALSNMGALLHDQGHLEDALESYQKTLTYKPDYVDALNGAGLVLHDLARFDEALTNYRQALKIRPDFFKAQWNQSLTLLLIGNFESGFQQYESRYNVPEIQARQRFFHEKPRWLGDTDIAHKTILLCAEQGLGDTLQFIRYISMFKVLGANVLLRVQPSLRLLLQSYPGVQEIYAEEVFPHFDIYCPIMSLPFIFKTTIETIPHTIPYVTAKSDRVEYWKKKLHENDTVRIGLIWSGRSAHHNDRNRSIALRTLLPIVEEFNGHFFALQKEIRQSDLLDLQTCPSITDLSSYLTDFSETAAIIANLDLIITVDTSVAHLAGAMGKPVWIMLPFVPDWRWMLDRDDSPWYPTARLFRQPAIGDWDSVIRDVQQALKSLYH